MTMSAKWLALGASIVFSSATALADECVDDADCPEGMACLTGEADCPSVTCPPGGECPEPEPCDETYAYCAPMSCEADADCGGDLVCESFTWTECVSAPTQACPVGEECPEPEPVEPDCEDHEEAYCVPDWLGACEDASDCGAGFSCESVESCACAGGDATSSNGDEEEASPEEDCTCEETGEGYCEPLEIPCESADDCPTDWDCHSFEAPSTRMCRVDEGGETICDETEPGEPELLCVPPHWDMIEAYDEAGEDVMAAAAKDERNDESSVPGEPRLIDDVDAYGCSAVGATPFALFALLPLIRRRRS